MGLYMTSTVAIDDTTITKNSLNQLQVNTSYFPYKIAEIDITSNVTSVALSGLADYRIIEIFCYFSNDSGVTSSVNFNLGGAGSRVGNSSGSTSPSGASGSVIGQLNKYDGSYKPRHCFSHIIYFKGVPAADGSYKDYYVFQYAKSEVSGYNLYQYSGGGYRGAITDNLTITASVSNGIRANSKFVIIGWK